MIFDYITAVLELRLEVGINGFEHFPPGRSVSISSPDSCRILIDLRMRAEKNHPTYSARQCSWQGSAPGRPQSVLIPFLIFHQISRLPWKGKQGVKKHTKKREKTPEEVIDVLESVGVCNLNDRVRPVILSCQHQSKSCLRPIFTWGSGVTSAHSGRSQ